MTQSLHPIWSCPRLQCSLRSREHNILMILPFVSYQWGLMVFSQVASEEKLRSVLKNFDISSFGSFFTQIPLVNDDLPARIISGRVQVKPNVKEFCGSSAVFVDGSIIDKACITTILRLWIDTCLIFVI